jgi:long-chain acyl-CoA synthetase
MPDPVNSSGQAFGDLVAQPVQPALLVETRPSPETLSPRLNLLTLNDIFYSAVEREARILTMQRGPAGWISSSSSEFYRNVAGVARALLEWGISPGDRVAILAENRPEWTIADFACLLLGAVVVPIYPTLTAEQMTYILNDSGARVIFLSTEVQLQKITAIQKQTSLEKIVTMDPAPSQAFFMDRLMRSGPLERDSQLDARARAIRPADLATIIYTSGTTGVPKGVMLTHGNMASNITRSLEGYDLGPGDLSISFLPLSHVTARHLDLAMLSLGVVLAYVSPPDQLPKALLELRPTIFVGVPRVYEKTHAQIESRATRFPKSWVLRWALHIGRIHRSEILARQVPKSFGWKLANRLVYSKIREGMGGRVKFFISGGAPLGLKLAAWYADLGIRIHEGYGLTETSPVIALNKPNSHKLGTVGKPLPNLEVRIAPDGEILVRGPSVFQSYWNRPDETQRAFTDGWFKTGDIGQLDSEGFLSVTDRKKDLIKTSGGKFIAPQPIESSLKHNPLIAEAAIVGDQRKFCAVLIFPHFPLLEDWARANQVPFTSRQELVSQPRVGELYEGIVAHLNRDLAQFEKLKKVLLIAEEFTTDNGLLTASMKLRRRAVEERFRARIEQMYAEAAAVSPPSS